MVLPRLFRATFLCSLLRPCPYLARGGGDEKHAYPQRALRTRGSLLPRKHRHQAPRKGSLYPTIGLFRLLGAGISDGGFFGALTALLCAPKKGAELRRDIAKKCSDATQKSSEFIEEVCDHTKDLVGKAKDKASDLIGIAKDKMEDLQDKVHDVKEKGKEKAHEVYDHVKDRVRDAADNSKDKANHK